MGRCGHGPPVFGGSQVDKEVKVSYEQVDNNPRWIGTAHRVGREPAGAVPFRNFNGRGLGPSQAVVPNATVKLVNEPRDPPARLVTNEEGYFSFASVAVGNFTYTLTVEAPGFVGYKATGLGIRGARSAT